MDKIKTTLLYIIIILLLYVFLYTYVYSNKEFTFDDYNNTIQKSNFINLKNEDGILYNTKINNAKTVIEDIKNNDLQKLNERVNNIVKDKKTNNKNILENLTELYFKQYIEYMNKQNAVVYNEYLKYNNHK
jgi:hypothetical protein